MSIAETYLLASKARAKLTKEAAKGDHDLRVLVSHANLLDNLMESIHNHKFPKQQQQPSSILHKTTTPSNLHHTTTVTFVDEDELDDEFSSDDDVVEDDDEINYTINYDSDSDSDSEDDEDYEDYELESEEEDEEEDITDVKDEDPWRIRFSYHNENDSSLNFRQLPTIDELTEQELQTLEENESESESEGEPEEADIVDIIYSNQPPQLSYSTTDESESESEEEELHNEEHHDHKYQDQDGIFQKQLQHELNINTTAIVAA